MSKVPDVSSYQGNIDWQKVADSGVVEATTKITEGLDYVDPMGLSNVRRALAAGLKVNVYHFAHPHNDPVQEANHFVAVIKETGGADKLGDLILDIEVNDGLTSVTDWILRFLGQVQTATSKPVENLLWYSYTAFIKRYVDITKLTQFGLWIANYGSTPGLSGYVMWQYTDAGTVPGINGKVDMSITGTRGEIVMATLLQAGDSGAEVRTLQEELNKTGANLVVDGQFGPSTESAVKHFQTTHGLTADGVVGPMTEQKLQDVLNPTPPPQPVEAPKPTPVEPPKPAPAPAPKPKPIDKVHLTAIILTILAGIKTVLQMNHITIPNVDTNQIANDIATVLVILAPVWAAIRHNATK